MNKSTSTPKKLVPSKLDVKRDNKQEIFELVKKIFSRYVPPLSILTDTSNRFELVSKKEVEFMGKRRDNMYFGAVMIHKGFVGLYLMHIYAQKDQVKLLGPELLKTLKGKSCFHLKSIDEDFLVQINEAIENGIKCYQKLNFI